MNKVQIKYLNNLEKKLKEIELEIEKFKEYDGADYEYGYYDITPDKKTLILTITDNVFNFPKQEEPIEKYAPKNFKLDLNFKNIKSGYCSDGMWFQIPILEIL